MSNEIATTNGTELSFMEQSATKAKEIQKFVKEQKLTTDLSFTSKKTGKKTVNIHVNVEGWQFACMLFGVTPVVTSCKKIPAAERVFIYNSVVELVRDSDGVVVARGFAMCSNQESKLSYWEENAIASMSQTRAIGKACRTKYAFIMKMAGYATTPTEEMEGAIKEVDPEKVRDAELFIHTATEIDQLTAYWADLEEGIQIEMRDAFNKKYKELKAAK